MNLELLTKPYYLFDPMPDTISAFFWIFSVFFIITIIGSVVLKKVITQGLSKKLLRSYPKTFFWLGITGILLEFFRYERVPYLSMRIVIYVLALSIIILSIRMGYVWFKVYPRAYKNSIDEIEKKKYLPKKKA